MARKRARKSAKTAEEVEREKESAEGPSATTEGTDAHTAGTGAHHAGTGATLFEKRQTEERNHVEAVVKVVVTAVAGDHESYVAMEISYSQRRTHHICRESVQKKCAR